MNYELRKRRADTRPWGPWEDRSHLRGFKPGARKPSRCYCNRLYAVQFYEDVSPFMVMVNRHDKGDIISWSHLQRIKNELVGESAFAVQVFPPESKLVDQANMFHLWVFPEGTTLGIDWMERMVYHADR